MSLSKNIKHYRCVVLINRVDRRQYTGGGPNTLDTSKMSLKVISNSQFKLMNSIKQYFNKVVSDKTIQTALSKEIANMMQKYQPSVYGKDLVRSFESTMTATSEIVANNTGTGGSKDVKKPDASSISNVINGLSMKLKIGKEEPVKNTKPDVVVPKWKVDVPVISNSSIQSRTTQIINSITLAETNDSKVKYIQELCTHLQKYPAAKGGAVKEGAIRLILRIQEKTDNNLLHAVIGEAFALLGYVKPLPGRGIRILSIDGGGIRGLAVIEMLKKLEELTGRRVYEMFDYICGVSTGAIVATTLGALQLSCEQLKNNYLNLSTEIFTQSTIKGTSNLVWSHSYYNTELWEKLLRQQLGESTLLATNRIPNCPKVATVSAIVNHEPVSAYVFRNYSFPWRVKSQYMGGMDHKLWEATRASAAAPTYFEECRLGSMVHQDGGIYVNNPTALALHEAKLLWPDSPIQCVVSLGTGRMIANQVECSNDKPASATSWKNKFMKIIDSATDTESVHTMLSDLLPSNVYFRFNPYLTEILAMTEINPQKLDMMDRDVVMYLRRNEDKFQQAARALLEERTLRQRTTDFIMKKCEFLGLTSKL